MLALSASFALAGPAVIHVMTTAQAVRDVAEAHLIWMVLAPVAGFAAWMFDGIYIGATRTRDMRNMMLISVGVYFAALALLLPAFGNHGLWMALLISFVMRGITLGLKYPALEAEARGRAPDPDRAAA